MNFKQFKRIQLRRIKVWLWYQWLLVETWYIKHFGKKYNDIDELMDDLE